MNFRNKDLTQVFDEKYAANHNKKLNELAKDNKKNLTNRMFNGTSNSTSNVIGYDTNRVRGNNNGRFI